MAISKFVGVLQSLLATTLKRVWKEGDGQRTDEDIKLALTILKDAVTTRPVWIVADNSRLANDFILATGIRGVYVWSLHQCMQIYKEDQGAHVIVLHAGPRSPSQREAYAAMIFGLSDVSNVDLWHVGTWRI